MRQRRTSRLDLPWAMRRLGVGASGWVAVHADQGDAPQRIVSVAVAPVVEPVAVGAT
jgi:hypothetical protein